MSNVNGGPITVRRMELWVSGGSLMVSWPDPMTMVDIEDVEASLAIWMRGLKRRAAERKEGEK